MGQIYQIWDQSWPILDTLQKMTTPTLGMDKTKATQLS